ncbi:hypothetical protein [Acinetobacter sp. ANC 4173]|uniref:hypothetical protein n=1 Tax=Acinetobacter sp. ANC 4173 TaxID=2529837 RepID=UPI00103F12D7|nr:hypothetical protein [Acinetobacter sp. ANC 4173]TCB74154.1 hypothetical protein E0H94_17600 [Acinetobacter sp. ANC 4173]
MSVIPSLAAGLAQLQALNNYIDQGSANATFVFYDDAKPASTAVTANDSAKLVTLTLPKPSLLSVNADGISFDLTDAGMIIKTGTAIWARLFNGDGVVVADFLVGTDIIPSTADLALGSTLKLDSITFRPST